MEGFKFSIFGVKQLPQGPLVPLQKRIVDPSAYIAIPLSRKIGKMVAEKKIDGQLVTDSSKRLKSLSTKAHSKPVPSSREEEKSLDKELSSGLSTLKITINNDRGKRNLNSSSTRRAGSSNDVAKKLEGLVLKEKGRERFDREKRRTTTKDERKPSSTSGSRTTDKHSKKNPSSTSRASSTKTAKGRKLKSTIGSHGDNITSRVTRGDLNRAASGKKPLEEVGRKMRSFLENSIAKGSKIKLNEPKKVDWYSRK